MYALIENSQVTQVGELAILFPNTSNPNHAFAIEQGALEVVEGEQKDQRFYWVTFDSYQLNGSVVTRQYTNTPKALEDKLETKEDGSPLYVQVWDATVGERGEMVDTTEQVVTKGLKSQWIAQNKANANSLLASTDWMVIRNTFNVTNNKLAPNLSEAENSESIGNSTQNNYDFLSNGFKARTTNGSSNENGSTFIYMAFAENPFKYSLAR